MILLPLWSTPSFADLARDLELSCEQIDPGPHASPIRVLRAERLGGLCSRDRGSLGTPAVREQLRRERLDAPGTFSSWATWLELRFDRSELDKLVFAQANLATLDLDGPEGLLDGYAPYLWFHVVHGAIDEAQLRREIGGEPTFEGELDQVLLEVYAWQKEQYARLEQLRAELAEREPELASVFEVAASTWREHRREQHQYATFAQSLDALTRTLVDGGTPMRKTCEAHILDFQGEHADTLGWDSTLMQTSTHVAAACARVRGDATLLGSLTLMLDDRTAVLGPLSAIVRDVNAHLAGQMAQGGAPRMKPALPLLRSGDTPSGPFEETSRTDWGYGRARTAPVTGPLQVASLRRVAYRGHIPYLQVTTAPMDAQVPNVDCAPEQDGWEVRDARIQPRMTDRCTATAGTHLHQVEAQTFLLPEAYGHALVVGGWFRHKGYLEPSEEGAFTGIAAERLHLAVPVYVAPTLDAFTAVPERMGPGSQARPTLSQRLP